MAPIEDPEVDEEVPETDDILLPMNEVTVWIDPLDATQVGFQHIFWAEEHPQLLTFNCF